MPFKTFVDGPGVGVLPASDINNYLMSQVVIRCTSTTRPSSPAVGWTIFETDTFRFLQYASASTGWQPPWCIGWGRVGGAVITTTATTTSATAVDIPGLNVSISALANRRYRAMACVGLAGVSGSGVATVSVLNATTSTQIAAVSNSISAGEYEAIVVFAEFTATTGTHTLKPQWAVTGGANISLNVSATVPITFHVEDIGPAGAPL